MIPNNARGTRWFHPVVPSNAGTHTPCRQMLGTVLVADVSMKAMPVVMDHGVRRDDPRRGGAQITIASSLVPVTSQAQVPALMQAPPSPY